MVDHYRWSCDSCNFEGSIRDDSHVYKALKELRHPFGGVNLRKEIELCFECNKKLYTQNISLWGTNQTINIREVGIDFDSPV